MKVSKKVGAKNGLGERERKVSGKRNNKGNGLGERDIKVSKREGGKEIDWETGKGRGAKRKEQRKWIGRNG
jgi:hypothetical protein